MFHEHKHVEQDLLEEMMREERSEESGAQKELLISRGCLALPRQKGGLGGGRDVGECLVVRQREGGGTDD